MRRWVALASLVAPLAALALSVPSAPSRFLYDGANVLSSSDRGAIEDRLMELNRAGLQVGVAVLPSLEGENLEEASHQIASKWGVGGKEQSDGVLISMFMADRKMRIEVGYGLEDKVPDAVAKQIISTQMRPAFRNGNFAEGILRAVDSVAVATGRAPPVQRTYPGVGTGYSRRNVAPANFGGLVCPCIAFFAVVMLLRLISRATRPRYYGFGARNMYSPSMPWWAWLLLGNAMGGGRNRSGWSSGSGRGWGGGGGGFGGGGGGSFGGGSFGGGGASGSW